MCTCATPEGRDGCKPGRARFCSILPCLHFSALKNISLKNNRGLISPAKEPNQNTHPMCPQNNTPPLSVMSSIPHTVLSLGFLTTSPLAPVSYMRQQSRASCSTFSPYSLRPVLTSTFLLSLRMTRSMPSRQSETVP